MFGERLGKWILSTEIGRGGMGRVYLAQEDLTGRQAAVKILTPELAVDSGFLGRFQREVEALSQLSHPHVVQLYDAGDDAGRYFYAMEYVPGKSLDEILEEKHRLGWREFLDIALQISPALKHVHDHGIIHRDIKLSNILVRDDGIVKLTDFGIAKVFATTDLTQTGGVIGTAEYLSPEQAMGKPVTKRSDIYSLGVVFYCLLTGRLPFEGTGFLDLMHKHRYSQFDRPGKIVFDVPHEIDELVCAMLEKEPAKRPPDCMVLTKQLESIQKKMLRKDHGTRVADTETVAQTKAVFDPKRAGPLGQVDRPASSRGLIGRILNHPLVVGILLAIVVGAMIWPFLQRPDPNEMFEKGASLMASDRLSDKETAWRDFFEPVLRVDPKGPLAGKIEKYRRQLEAARNPESTEAGRFVELAERRYEAGDVAGAVSLWRNVIDAFDGVPDEEPAVEQARRRLDAYRQKAGSIERMARIRLALERADALAAQGKVAEADRIRAALEELYRGDPSADTLRKLIDAARK